MTGERPRWKYDRRAGKLHRTDRPDEFGHLGCDQSFEDDRHWPKRHRYACVYRRGRRCRRRECRCQCKQEHTAAGRVKYAESYAIAIAQSITEPRWRDRANKNPDAFTGGTPERIAQPHPRAKRKNSGKNARAISEFVGDANALDGNARPIGSRRRS